MNWQFDKPLSDDIPKCLQRDKDNIAPFMRVAEKPRTEKIDTPPVSSKMPWE